MTQFSTIINCQRASFLCSLETISDLVAKQNISGNYTNGLSLSDQRTVPAEICESQNYNWESHLDNATQVLQKSITSKTEVHFDLLAVI